MFIRPKAGVSAILSPRLSMLLGVCCSEESQPCSGEVMAAFKKRKKLKLVAEYVTSRLWAIVQ